MWGACIQHIRATTGHARRRRRVALFVFFFFVFSSVVCLSPAGGPVPDCSLTAIKFVRFAHFAYDIFLGAPGLRGPGGQRGAQAHAGYRPVYGAIERRASCL